MDNKYLQGKADLTEYEAEYEVPTFTHISDCWEFLRGAATVEELEDRIEELPNWAGVWDIVRNENGCAQIINEYEEYGCYQVDREDTDIEMEEE